MAIIQNPTPRNFLSFILKLSKIRKNLLNGTENFTKKLNAARHNAIGPNAARNRLTMDVERHADTSEDRKRKRVKDRADRATVEQVLDPRTRLVLFRLLQRGTLLNIDGCISTGKEANVYHATGVENDLAVKIYKTSILTFKDRERYVTGEFRELGVKVLSVRRLFEVIVDPLMSSKEMETIVETERTLANSEDDALFMNAFIPHKLEHVLHFERDGRLAKEGVEANNPFQNIVSKIDLKGDGFGEGGSDSDEEENDKKTRKKRTEPTAEEIEEKERKIAMHTRNREETTDERKLRKAAVKEEKREQRKDKVPKHLKKRAHRQHMK
uniref:non-specific serine/threonine protein kinase n=1 Tax=Caenorhabditis japonica TaxID=281687 RepID=A0A8R1HLA7_CAEJA